MTKSLQSKILIGAREWCSIPELGFDRIHAKIDTGAKTSALHAENISLIQENGQDYVQFHVESCEGDQVTQILCKSPVTDRRLIKSSNGQAEQRYVISVDIHLGDLVKTIEITLTDRNKMRFNLLLGRTALAGDFVIDPARNHLLGEPL